MAAKVRTGANLPTILDVYLGQRVTAVREAANLSQLEMASGLNIAPEQLERHERGTLPIPVARLAAIARLVAVPVASLISGSPDSAGGERQDAIQEALARLTQTPDGQALVGAFTRIKDTHVRKRLIELVLAIIDSAGS